MEIIIKKEKMTKSIQSIMSKIGRLMPLLRIPIHNG